MIDVRELRIGNYIGYSEDSTFDFAHKVKGIDISGYVDTGYRKALKSDILFPIKLTEDILQEFGYEKVNEARHFSTFKGEPYVYFDGKYARFQVKTLDIEFVHQFQNAIFVFTGKELTKKEL